jgi:hypothetical protein
MRYKKEPSENDRRSVEVMKGYGIPDLDIARIVGVSVNCLRRWYPEELATGQAKANSAVAQSLFEKAMGSGQGAVTACIFWLKARAGWVEARPQDGPGKKEQQQAAASSVGGKGTEWANDLEAGQIN